MKQLACLLVTLCLVTWILLVAVADVNYGYGPGYDPYGDDYGYADDSDSDDESDSGYPS